MIIAKDSLRRKDDVCQQVRLKLQKRCLEYEICPRCTSLLWENVMRLGFDRIAEEVRADADMT